MQIFLVLHNLLRWAVLIFGVLAVVTALRGVMNKNMFTGKDLRMGKLFMIMCDVQLLIGLWLYFANDWFARLKTGIDMKNASARFFTIEHASMMILAWILVHVGVVAVKKAPVHSKHKRALIFFGLALLIILAAIPWPFREQIARPFLRGFN